MNLLAIDPGQSTHGYIRMNGYKVDSAGKAIPTPELLTLIRCATMIDMVAIYYLDNQAEAA